MNLRKNLDTTEGFAPVGGRRDLVAILLEVEGQEFAYGGFIVYNKDLHGIIRY